MSTDDHDPTVVSHAIRSTPRPSPTSDSFSSGSRSPSINEFDSSAALLVVPEREHDELDAEDRAAFSSSDDDSHEGELDDGEDDRLARSTGSRYTSGPTLSSLTVFLYLLAPLLKLGALLSSSLRIDKTPLRLSLPALFFFASLCAFTRQIWYMLARYVKRADMEEVVLQTFARGIGRGREGEKKRRLIRLLVRSSTGLLRILLVAIYLRGEHAPGQRVQDRISLPSQCSLVELHSTVTTRQTYASAAVAYRRDARACAWCITVMCLLVRYTRCYVCIMGKLAICGNIRRMGGRYCLCSC